MDHPGFESFGDFKERLKDVVAKEEEGEKIWFWLSFADESGPLGVAIVKDYGVVSAAKQCYMRGINPGGEIFAYPLDKNNLPPYDLRNRLLDREQLLEAGLIDEES